MLIGKKQKLQYIKKKKNCSKAGLQTNYRSVQHRKDQGLEPPTPTSLDETNRSLRISLSNLRQIALNSISVHHAVPKKNSLEGHHPRGQRVSSLSLLWFGCLIFDARVSFGWFGRIFVDLARVELYWTLVLDTVPLRYLIATIHCDVIREFGIILEGIFIWFLLAKSLRKGVILWSYIYHCLLDQIECVQQC